MNLVQLLYQKENIGPCQGYNLGKAEIAGLFPSSSS
jgi:hypothetical protein